MCPPNRRGHGDRLASGRVQNRCLLDPTARSLERHNRKSHAWESLRFGRLTLRQDGGHVARATVLELERNAFGQASDVIGERLEPVLHEVRAKGREQDQSDEKKERDDENRGNEADE